MTWLGAEVLAVSAAAVLLLAGCTKLASPGTALLEPLFALGVPTGATTALTALLGLAEVTAAILLVLERGPWASVFVGALAVVFLAAGALSWRRGLDVPCRCLGLGRAESRLGLRQVLTFPAWLVIAALPLLGSFATAATQRRWWAFVALAVVVAGLFIGHLARRLRSARELRLAVGHIA